MKERTYDKSMWGEGPWQTEPDRVEWRSHQFPCLIVRNDSCGNLCGYVGVPAMHPWYGKGYDDVEAEVHGSLTFAGGCHDDSPICHVPKRGEPKDVWWFGFDCAHLGDLVPFMSKIRAERESRFDFGESYKGIPFLTAEVELLAKQAAAAEMKETLGALFGVTVPLPRWVAYCRGKLRALRTGIHKAWFGSRWKRRLMLREARRYSRTRYPLKVRLLAQWFMFKQNLCGGFPGLGGYLEVKDDQVRAFLEEHYPPIKLQ